MPKTSDAGFSLKHFMEHCGKACTCLKRQANTIILGNFYCNAQDPNRVIFGQGTYSDPQFTKHYPSATSKGLVLTDNFAPLTAETAFAYLGDNTEAILKGINNVSTVEEVTILLGLKFTKQ
jgi:hypothetical protein